MILLLARIWEGMGWLDAGIVVVVFGWNFAGVWHGLRNRDFEGFAFRSICLAVSFAAVCIMWDSFEDWRWVLLGLPFSASYSVVRLKRRTQKVAAKRTYALFTGVVGFNVATFCVLTVAPFGMRTTTVMTATQPGSQYTAAIINLDGIAFGYDRLELRPNRLSVWTMLDRPQRTVAEFDEEQKVTDLKWDSDHQLTVKIVPGSVRVWDIPKWHGIKIRYVDDPDYGPDGQIKNAPMILKK